MSIAGGESEMVPRPLVSPLSNRNEVLTLSSEQVAEIMRARHARDERARAWAELRRIGVRTVDMPPVDAAPNLTGISDGAWRGRRCFLVGGGPSLRGFDFSRLRGERVIAINRAFEVCPGADILLAMDGRLYGWIVSGRLGENARAKFAEFRGLKLWLASSEIGSWPDVTVISNRGQDGLTDSIAAGLYHGSNSGYAALNLAVALGANPIYLLGYDGRGNGSGGQAWFHDGYPEQQGEGVYANFAGRFSLLAPLIRARGVRVVNLNPDSSVRCFEFGRIGDVLTSPVSGRISVITPTGDRPLAFGLLRRWMEAQARRPDQWIIVDDGQEPMRPGDWPDWATYLRREPQPDDPMHTLSANLARALPWITGEKIVVCEDDEYYAPGYIEEMARRLDQAEVVGVCENRYYHLPTGGYCTHSNRTHASLAQTAFRASSFAAEFADLLRAESEDFLDIRLWRRIEGTGRGLLFTDHERPLYVGIKGLPGRPGIGIGHDGTRYVTYDTPDRAELRRLIGADAEIYAAIAGEPHA